MHLRKKGPKTKRRRPLLPRPITHLDPLEPRQLFSATLYVDPAAPGPTHDGSAWTTAYTDLQSALTAANSGDTVKVAQGTYKPTTDANRTISFQLKSGVQLLGSYAGNASPSPDARNYTNTPTTLSGDIGAQGDNSDNSYHVLTINGSTTGTQIDGFTITAGNANGFSPNNVGGGLYVPAARTTIYKCTFTANLAMGSGGALDGEANLTDCAFANNSSAYGSGGAINATASGSLTRCTFINNSAGDSGGAISSGYSTTCTDCGFTANGAGGGGAVSIYGTSSTISGCTFSENIATNGSGGAISFTAGTGAPKVSLTLLNSTFTDNAARSSLPDSHGGAVCVSNSDLYATACAFTRNIASIGGAIFHTSYYDHNLEIALSTFAGNTASTGGALAISAEFDATLTGCLLVGNSAAYGGAISSGTVALASCTLDSNTATVAGGGIFSSGGTEYLENSIFWANSAPTDPQLHTAFAFDFYQGYNDVDGGAIPYVARSADPQFFRSPSPGPDATWGTSDDDYGDLRPAPTDNSPVIDVGINTPYPALPTTDLLGNPRIVNARDWSTANVDLGAYEMSPLAASAGGPRSAIAGQTVTLSASAASITRSPLTYAWDFNNDGVFDDATGSAPTFNTAGLSLGPHPIALRVTDGTGASLTDTATVTVYPPNVYVDSRATAGAHTGLSWSDALPDLAPALANAVPGQEIRVATGTYLPQLAVPNLYSDPRSPTFLLKNDVHLTGGWAGLGAPDPDARDIAHTPSTLSGNITSLATGFSNAYHVVTAAPGIESSALLDGFAIIDSHLVSSDSPSGAGIFVLSASPTIHSCTFTGDSTYPSPSLGGAAYISGAGAAPTFSDCTFSQNFASSGGAVYAGAGAAPAFSDCTFTGNGASQRGGAVYVDGGASPSFTDSTFSSNSASVTGGAIFASAAAVTLTRCSLFANTAVTGGSAVFLSLTASATVLDSAFVGNTGVAAIISVGPASQFTLTNDTLTGNVSSGASAAAVNLSFSTAAVTITNSILWNNTAATQLAGPDPSHSSVTHSLIQGGTAFPSSDILTADPLFTRNPSPGADGQWRTPDDDFGDLRLSQNSPAIDAGDNAAVPPTLTTDLAGNARLQGAAVDLGAYESAPVPPSATLIAPTTAPEGSTNTTLSLTNPTGTGPFTYSFDFNNDDTFEITNSTAASATIPASFLPDGPNTLTVHARISGPAGSTDYTAPLTITNAPPTAKIAPPSPTASYTAGQSYTFTASAADPSPTDTAAGFTYAWTISSGTGAAATLLASGAGATIPFAPAAAGPYTLTLTATDKDGATSAPATTVINVADFGAPTALIIDPPTSIQANTPLTLRSPVIDPAPGNPAPFTCHWTATLNGQTIASLTGGYQFTLTPTAPGQLTVTLTITNGAGKTSAPATADITVTAAPPPPDTTAPAAQPLTNLPAPTPGSSNYTFTVTYTDNSAINPASLANTNLLITGPSGFSTPATLLSITGSGPAVTATYAFPPPDFAWDSADNGIYTIALAPNQVTDTANNPAPAATLGSLTVNLPNQRPTDTTPPTAALARPLSPPAAGAADYTVTVTYTDDIAIDPNTLDSADLLLTGPANYSAQATLLSITGSGATLSATYSFPAPGGSWDFPDNGPYTLSLQPNQVTDTANNPALPTTLGAFTANLPNPDAPILSAEQGTRNPASPNLVVSTFALKKPPFVNGALLSGSNLSGTIALRNTGHANLTGSATITLYLSSDATASTADTVLKSFTLPLKTLKPGKSTKSTSFTLTLPATLADGTQNLIAVITPLSTESTTLDNAKSLSFHTAPAETDLAATALKLKKGKHPTATLTVKNTGNQLFNHTVPIALTFTDNATGNTTSLPTLTTLIKNLKPGQLKSLSLKSLPPDLATHHGTLTATLDPSDLLAQSSTTDDTATATL